MKVKELIELLKEENGERIVVMSLDGEGNSYSPLSSIGTASYLADSTWSGEVGLEELTENDKMWGYTGEDVMEDGEPAIILHPVK